LFFSKGVIFVEGIAEAILMFIHAGKAISRIFFKDSTGAYKGNFYCPESFGIAEWRTFLFDIMNSISNSVGLEFTDTWKVWKNSLKKTINQLQCNYED
jgi:hypothetical protein